MDVLEKSTTPTTIQQETTTPSTVEHSYTKKRKCYKNPSSYNFNCECGKNFSFKKHFNAHRRKVHSEVNTEFVVNGNNFQKCCPLCDYSTHPRFEMMEHFKNVHSITFAIEKHTFASENEFLLWKRNIEHDTTSQFSNKGSQHSLNHKITNFHCYRSGCYVPRGKGLRSLKTQGSCKINAFCPARIVKKMLNDGTCIVNFCGTHVGHQNELKHLHLETKEEIGDCLVIAESQNENFESTLQELSKNKPCQSISVRKEKLEKAFLETLGTVSNLDEIEIMEKMFVQVGPALAAVRDKTLPLFQMKHSFVPNKNIAPQRFYSTKKKTSKKAVRKFTTHTSADINKNASVLVRGDQNT